jgi:hypothetical protein
VQVHGSRLGTWLAAWFRRRERENSTLKSGRRAVTTRATQGADGRRSGRLLARALGELRVSHEVPASPMRCHHRSRGKECRLSRTCVRGYSGLYPPPDGGFQRGDCSCAAHLQARQAKAAPVHYGVLRRPSGAAQPPCSSTSGTLPRPGAQTVVALQLLRGGDSCGASAGWRSFRKQMWNYNSSASPCRTVLTDSWVPREVPGSELGRHLLSRDVSLGVPHAAPARSPSAAVHLSVEFAG